jgi:hypothetical protein
MVDPATRRAFETLVAAAYADGDLEDAERQLLHRKVTEWDIPLPMFHATLEKGRLGQLRVAIPPERKEKEALLGDLIDLACADGRVEAPEYHLLAKFGAHLGLSLAELRAQVKQRLDRKPLRAQERGTGWTRETRVDRTEASRRKPVPEPPPPTAEPQAPPSPAALPVQVSLLDAARSAEPIRPAVPAFAPSRAPVADDVPPAPPGPITLSPSSLLNNPFPELPPVTLELIKQHILFENENASVRAIERLMEFTRPEAVELRTRLLTAFPALRPGSPRLQGPGTR